MVDMGSCGEFTQDGRDNGLSPANVIEDQFDWHNDFVGQCHGEGKYFFTPGMHGLWSLKISRRFSACSLITHDAANRGVGSLYLFSSLMDFVASLCKVFDGRCRLPSLRERQQCS